MKNDAEIMREFEADFSFPKEINNEVEIPTANGGIVYRIRVSHITYDGSWVRGNCWLRKMKKTTEEYRKIESLIPFRRKDASRSMVEPLWEVYVENCAFILWGKVQGGRGSGARAALVAGLARRDVLISDKLLDRLLDPLEKKLLELVATIDKFPKLEKDTEIGPLRRY